MRKVFTLLFLFVVATLLGVAQTNVEIKFSTDKKKGEKITIWPSVKSGEEFECVVDWGDGKWQTKTINPSSWWGTDKRWEGEILGDTIRIKTKLSKLEADECGINYFEALGQDELEVLELNKNNLQTYRKLFLLEAKNLKSLSVNDNNLDNLLLTYNPKLERLNANGNPNLGTVVFYQDDNNTNEALQTISLNGGSISHFYPVKCPNLTSLSIMDGALMELDLADYYPALTSLSVGNFKQSEFEGNMISEINVTQLPKLSKLDIRNNKMIKTLDLSQNPELVYLFCEGNAIEKLNLTNNPKVSHLVCMSNKLTELNVSNLKKLTELRIDSNKIQRIDLTHNMYISDFSASDCDLEFVDFEATGVTLSLKTVDVRGNKRFSAQALNFMFNTMPARSRDHWGKPCCFIAGCGGAETCDTGILNDDDDKKWKTDVNGNASASMDPVKVTLENIEGATYSLWQPNEYGQEWAKITNHEVVPGRPIRIDLKVATPESDAYGGVEVDGTLNTTDTLFVVLANAVIKPILKRAYEPTIVLNVVKGTAQKYSLMTVANGDPIVVDWGDGVKTEIENTCRVENGKFCIVEGTAAGDKITITGNITMADFSSYPGNMELAYDNKITGIDLKKTSLLTLLSVFSNDVKTLDVSGQPNLTALDCAYCGLTDIDVSKNPNLIILKVSGNKISEINVANNEMLQMFEAKHCQLTELDMNQLRNVQRLNLIGNRFKTLDLAPLAQNLQVLDVSFNPLESLDVTGLPELQQLNAIECGLTELDLSKTKHLVSLYVDGNRLKSLDLSANQYLTYLHVESNGWTADQLTDMYHSLCKHFETGQPLPTKQTIWVKGVKNPNDAEGAESFLAEDKGWVVNIKGNGSGVTEVFIDGLYNEDLGEIILVDEKGKTYELGDKVKKNASITVKVKPETDYVLSKLTLNKKDILKEMKFVAEKSSFLMAEFTLGTGIETVEADADNAPYYTLKGVRVAQPKAGKIYIHKGKKVLYR